MATVTQPKKPANAVLFFHRASGYWCKKINGKRERFGTKGCTYAQAKRDYDQRGAAITHGLTVRRQPKISTLLTTYMDHNKAKLEDGELTHGRYRFQLETCRKLQRFFGPSRQLHAITGEDLEALCKYLAKNYPHWSPTTWNKELTAIRSVFNFGADYAELMPKPPLKRLRMKSKRAIANYVEKKPPRHFEAEEIRLMLEQPCRPRWIHGAMLLGVNCGLQSSELKQLRDSHPDIFDDNSKLIRPTVLVFRRQKCGTSRRCPLWNETLERLPGCTFPIRTKVTEAFNVLQKRIGIYQPGRSFRGLRHSFRKAADNADKAAIQWIMGHERTDICDRFYDTDIDDDRLIAVTDRVHKWLFG